MLAESQPETLEKYRVRHNPDRENLALWVSEYKRLSDASSRLKQQIKNLAFHAAPKARIILQRREQELQRLKQQLKNTKQEIETLLKAYWGMYPRRRQSGKYEARSRMATHGNRLMRHMLWNAAKCAARHNPVCKELYERLVARGKSAPAAYEAVARKLVQIIYGVLKNQTIFDPTLNTA